MRGCVARAGGAGVGGCACVSRRLRGSTCRRASARVAVPRPGHAARSCGLWQFVSSSTLRALRKPGCGPHAGRMQKLGRESEKKDRFELVRYSFSGLSTHDKTVLGDRQGGGGV